MVRYCYTGKYVKYDDFITMPAVEMPAVMRPAWLWKFSIDYEMGNLMPMARQLFEDAAGQEIDSTLFVVYLQKELFKYPHTRDVCLKVMERHAQGIFEDSCKYKSLRKAIKADGQLLFELTARLVRHQNHELRLCLANAVVSAKGIPRPTSDQEWPARRLQTELRARREPAGKT